MDKRMQELCTPVIFGSSKVAFSQAMGIEDFSFNLIENLVRLIIKSQPHQLLGREAKITIGENTSEGGNAFVITNGY